MPAIATNDSLAAFLADRDLFCPGCGYNLRGLTSAHCPECRQHLVLTVSLAEPPIVQYVLAIVGIAACGAALCMFLAFAIVVGLPNGLELLSDEGFIFLWLPAALTALDAILVALLLLPAFRRWFRARGRFARWLFVLACWGTSVVVATTWVVLCFNY